MKNYYNNLAVCDYLSAHGDGTWLFLTLTCRNVEADELSGAIDELMRGWKHLTKNVRVRKVIRGFYRGLEVTHDTQQYITAESYKRRKRYLDSLGFRVGDPNPTYDTFHPHFHVLVYVDKSYFTSSKYLSHAKWSEAWKQALSVDYTPVVHVERVGSFRVGADYNVSGAIAEVSKYSTKDSDVIVPDDWDLTVDTVRTLDAALANRRLIAYGGEVREAYRRLKLDDAENGDLVDVGESTVSGDDYKTITYYWHTGYRQYLRYE